MDEDGYGDSPITNDLITDIYLEFIMKTRQEESVEYCKTREGPLYIVISLEILSRMVV
jgi:hypothetical protein